MASLVLWLLDAGERACGFDSAEVCGACIMLLLLVGRCHPWTGDCECKPGWDGKMCSRPCPFYTYGKGCRNNCNCKNDAQCTPVNGTCICAAGVQLSGLYAEAE
jgi:Laminin EGF-like (Domains III and V).